MDAPVQCSACISPCLTCLGTERKCLTCINNFTLTNGKCISNFRFQFSVTFQAVETEFYAAYNTIV